jgi:hypothetical protein
MSVESNPGTPPPFLPELQAPDPALVRQYFAGQTGEKGAEAYRNLVRYLSPTESRLVQQDINDPKNVWLLANALQRRENLLRITNSAGVENGPALPGTLTAIINQLPAEIPARAFDDATMVSFLSPAERQALLQSEVITQNGDTDFKRFLVKQSLLAIAFNRQKQQEYEESIAATQPIKVKRVPSLPTQTNYKLSDYQPIRVGPRKDDADSMAPTQPIRVAPRPEEKLADTQPVRVISKEPLPPAVNSTPEAPAHRPGFGERIRNFFGIGREDVVGRARNLLQRGDQPAVDAIMKDLYQRIEANKKLPDSVSKTLEGSRLDRDFNEIIREESKLRHRRQ